MPSDPLLPDPSDVERALTRRWCPEPSADLRGRILAAVSEQRQAAARPLRRNRWNVVWQAAAAVIVAGNLWMTAANTVRVGHLMPPPLAAPDVVDAFVGADPFQQLAARVLVNLKPAPQTGALGRDFFSNEEDRQWALR
jgi:hypothetical protein